MQSSLVVAALLCFTTWMSSVHAIYGPVRSCCVQWSNTRVPIDRIVNYTIQSEDICRIRAVQFRTWRGKTLCSNPDAEWTKRAIQKVDKETKAFQEKRRNEEGSASDMTPTASTPTASTPTASTTLQNTPQKNDTMGEDRREGGTGSSENVAEKSQSN